VHLLHTQLQQNSNDHARQPLRTRQTRHSRAQGAQQAQGAAAGTEGAACTPAQMTWRVQKTRETLHVGGHTRPGCDGRCRRAVLALLLVPAEVTLARLPATEPGAVAPRGGPLLPGNGLRQQLHLLEPPGTGKQHQLVAACLGEPLDQGLDLTL
jgi:hypothetical protein